MTTPSSATTGRRRRTWLDWKEQGREAYRAGDYAAALTAYQTALEPMYECAATADRQMLLSNVVACRLQLGQANDQALSEAQACVQLDPSWSKGHVRLAAVYIALGGRSNEACNELQTALRLDPSNRTARTMLVQELRRDGPAPPPQNPAYVPPTTTTTPRGDGNSHTTSHTTSSAHIDIDDDDILHDNHPTWLATWRARWEEMKRHVRAWYHAQSPETIRNLAVGGILVVLVVLWSSSVSSSSSRHTHGNYGADNAYEAFYRQRAASSSRQGDYAYDASSHAYDHRSYGGSRYDDSYSYSTTGSGGADWSYLLYLAGLAYILHLQGINPLNALFLLPRRRRMWGGAGGMWGRPRHGGYRRRRGPFGGGIFFLVYISGLVVMTTAAAASPIPTIGRKATANVSCLYGGRSFPSPSSHRLVQTIFFSWSALTMICLGGVIVSRIQQQKRFFFVNALSRYSVLYGRHRRSLHHLQPLFSSPSSTERRLNSKQAPSGYNVMFDLDLPEGRCVGVRMDDIRPAETASQGTEYGFASWVTNYLHPDEVQHAQQLSSESTQKTFLGGRLALRHAMGCAINDCIILKDVYGRPRLPASVLGSVSHKGNVAVALVATNANSVSQNSPSMGIGIDLEVRQGGHEHIARRILTPHEREQLGKLAHVDANEEVLLRFSIKEALYKAMHPLICQYVGFQEAECQPLDDGTVQVHLNLASGAHHAFGTVSANWRIMDDDYFLTSAQVQLKPDSPSIVADKDPEECHLRQMERQ